MKAWTPGSATTEQLADADTAPDVDDDLLHVVCCRPEVVRGRVQ